ncbi:MAG: hypothetical protein D8M57_09165 [Candidatus Scalindua sp. AMX11]|nr:MAG: hypothetical protein DWQ00_00605 [Candidatus Scalindua sp.]NOG83037.1 hypothetical protein [Planctomycetota bacterium]RZV79563.1 MAG: hypothetical protein EX341_11040 [Candidatus Scalindua sp. SCAELEC01]TDE65202.1 MAG: hypothetical protein D8M57_09165 [Candidatus Scalindua sp. AMX11]GJQ58562.1 MAG: hypothetical protein SCALA701_13630 [Candidatus Scalindua sp.]
MSTLEGKKILITAGSTRGYIDSVRFITNISTGKLGCEIAMESMAHGAIVTYVYGKGSLFPLIEDCNHIKTQQLELIEIETNRELESAIQVTLKCQNFDAIVHAMAVSDYIPATRIHHKISSDKDELTIRFVKTAKVIDIVRNIWPESYLVGFKLVVQKRKDEMLQIAYDFLKKCSADLIIVNDSKEISDTDHIAYFVGKNREMTKCFYSKKEIAKGLLHLLEQQLT